MTTADRIRNRRLELGLTQLEVAKRLGLTSKAAVCKVEKQGDDVTLKNVEKFAMALSCTPAYLMGWSDEKQDVEVIAESERYKAFVESYELLDMDQQKIIDNLISTFLSKK